ncbi:beta-lactamase family protein [Geodermatophilus sp. YIM 151500]|uniref:serine hydrolase domain-containing protein n=1 Tax=Geodermatophilus sp. YIM 151500 TaxID=2984531 RepID=UPI0021E40913|nr:serine hydrolase domain-containing protein [Geodermatophilus sp. YIM 151500]MCV2487872.1 beta-lactamase family protein [Geodermatophilus sp. YIM 151500]
MSPDGRGRLSDMESRTTTDRFAPVQAALQRQVDEGRVPGFVAAVRYAGRAEVLTGGRPHLDADAPMRAGTQFRLASVSKPFAGALTLSLVEHGALGLDDPVDRWLPELADARVLSAPGADLTDTRPVDEPITVRHLLTSTAGFGGLWDDSPLAVAMDERGLSPGPFPPTVPPDEYLRRLGGLPLAARPGERWLYHTSTDVLSVLLARATGRPLPDLLAERVTGPLQLHGTGFTADPARLATQYAPTDDGLALLDPPGGRFARPPAFAGLAAGLVSTAPDVLAFLCALADGGSPVLGPSSVALMTTDALAPEQRAPAQDFLGPGISWGLQVGVTVEADGEGRRPWATPGRWGWDGGTGTSAWVDPAHGLVGVLLTQRLMGGPDDGPDAFWAAVHDCL